jgi:hypothetical protein
MAVTDLVGLRGKSKKTRKLIRYVQTKFCRGAAPNPDDISCDLQDIFLCPLAIIQKMHGKLRDDVTDICINMHAHYLLCVLSIFG